MKTNADEITSVLKLRNLVPYTPQVFDANAPWTGTNRSVRRQLKAIQRKQKTGRLGRKWIERQCVESVLKQENILEGNPQYWGEL